MQSNIGHLGWREGGRGYTHTHKVEGLQLKGMHKDSHICKYVHEFSTSFAELGTSQIMLLHFVLASLKF